MLTPGEMAARLLHVELELLLRATARQLTAKPAAAPDVDRHDRYRVWADRTVQCLSPLPAWRTLYDRLRANPA